MSSEEESTSGHGSDFEPENEPDSSPVRKPLPKSTSTKRGKERKKVDASAPTTPNSKSPSAGSNASTSQQANPLQGALLFPAMGPGGIPMMMPGQQQMTNNERAHLYSFLRQLPLGFARADGNAAVGTGPLPFPFPLHPGLLAPGQGSGEGIGSAHDAEAPDGEQGDELQSPGRLALIPGGTPGKPRPEPGTLEWARMRKDNHKEVERRRRGNINEGINELARLIPNAQGDKAKGAILTRAVQYLKGLKEMEQKNVEKWTMEKLLADQQIGELQLRCGEAEKLWAEEKMKREDLEAEVDRLKRRFGETEEDELDEDEDEEERPTKRMRLG